MKLLIIKKSTIFRRLSNSQFLKLIFSKYIIFPCFSKKKKKYGSQ